MGTVTTTAMAGIAAAASGGGIEVITASRTLTAADSGKIFDNRGATNIVMTIPAGLIAANSDFTVAGKRSSTGTVQILDGVGVTPVGDANITALQGQYVYASANGVADSYDVKAG